MRILHIINDLRIGGAERLLTDLAPLQRDAGHAVSVATLAAHPSFLETALRDAGIDVTASPHSLRSPRQASWLAGQMRGVDIVHVHLFPTQLWAALAAVMLGKDAPPLLTTEHNTHNRRREMPLLKPIDAAMYRRYARIVAISPATAMAINNYLPETRAKTQTIGNGIALDRFDGKGSPEERAALFPTVPPGAPLIISVGRLEKQKDVLTLLRGISRVENVHLALVGDGPLRDDLERKATAMRIDDRTHFLGRRDDVPKLLRNADLYAQSSAWEGFGIGAVEAMASGLPVVHSDVPGLRDVVGEDAGVAFPVGEDAKLSRRLQELLADAPRRQRLSAAAKERAAQFSIEICAAAYLEAYREIVAIAR